MDKSKIRNFAVNARERLLAGVRQRLAGLGIDDQGVKAELEISTANVKYYTNENFPVQGAEIEQRNQVVQHLQRMHQENDDWQAVLADFIEEVAYTWFNRIIALRFMEVNDYLPSRVRVLSSEEGWVEPDIINHALEIEDDLGGFTPDERERISQAQLTQNPQELDAVYAMLFIKQTDALADILPGLFEKTADYLKLLFTPKYNDGVIKALITAIPEADFDVEQSGQVEIIGWMYQFYNSELKDVSFKKKKYTTSDIPAVTQLFTPSWIVKYMVENSLGRYWIDTLHARGDSRSEKEIAQAYGWKYYMPAAPQAKNIVNEVEPKDITEVRFIDPSMGSGHVLVYAFQVFMQIYESEGYLRRTAALSILENNLYGLDIDTRAYQLAYFALMMKGRQYDRRFFSRDVSLNLVDIPQAEHKTEDYRYLVEKYVASEQAEKTLEDIGMLLGLFAHGNDLGSIIKVPQDLNLDQLEELAQAKDTVSGELSFDDIMMSELQRELWEMVEAAKLLSSKYEVGVTNPPYMGSRRMPVVLNKYVTKRYPESKTDLFAVFIEKLLELLDSTGYMGMVTQHSWMFLSSYENLRTKLQNKTLVNMAHLGTRAFEEIGGEVVQSTAFIIQNKRTEGYIGTYERLVDYKSQQAKEEGFLASVAGDTENVYRTPQSNFTKIPGSPVAYWLSQRAIYAFEQKKLEDYGETRAGMITGNNLKFVRLWTEVSFGKIGLGMRSRIDAEKSLKKWFPYNKGGEFRKWYGNNEYVVNWENDGFLMRTTKNDKGKVPAHAFNLPYIFKKNITWNAISSYKFSARQSNWGFLYDASGSFADINLEYQPVLLALLCSKITFYYLSAMNPTLNFQKGNISDLPIITDVLDRIQIAELSLKNTKISKQDWDAFETSWDFQRSPLLTNKATTLQDAYNNWEYEALERFNQLKANEEELNRIFIDIYGLQDELTPEEDDKDVTVRKADPVRDIKAFLSYFIGCVFGRYSLDVDGLAYAGGDWDPTKYQTFTPNEDNIILLTDRRVFNDQRDIIVRLREFLKVVFGADHLADNLHFIAETLAPQKIAKGTPVEQVIRDYFSKDFYKDHVQMYSKRPIYWQFSSGRSDGFKALMYLHRYDHDELAMARDYLHQLQEAYNTLISFNAEQEKVAATAKEKNNLSNDTKKLNKMIDEMIKYDAALQHQALAQIDLDLDDGVVVNHAKLQGDEKLLTKF